MVIARKIAYNVLASSLSKILATVLALISIGFITRYLGKEGFGNYATVLAFLSFFAAISDLGLYHIATREISRTGADEKKIIGNIFSIRLLSAAAILALAPLFAWVFPYPPEVKRGIVIMAASFIFSSGYQVLNGIFQKNLAMDRVVFGELIGKFIQTTFIILAVKMNLGFDWIMASLLGYMIISFSIIFKWSRKYLKFTPQFDLVYWKKFLKESLPMGVVAIITFCYFKMDTILLSVIKGGSDVGIYNAAYKVIENITFFPAMVIGLVLPIMSKNIFTDRKEFENVSNKTFKFFVLLVVPLIVGTLFLSDGIINLIGGAGFAESGRVLQILVFALAFIFFGHFFNAILIVGNLQKKLMYVLGCAAVINIILNLWLIPKFSYSAAAAVSVLTELLVVIFAFCLTFRNIKYFPKLEKLPNIFFAGLLMALFLFLFSEINFFLRALGSVVLYVILLWFLKAIKTSEITSIISKKGVEEYEELP